MLERSRIKFPLYNFLKILQKSKGLTPQIEKNILEQTKMNEKSTLKFGYYRTKSSGNIDYNSPFIKFGGLKLYYSYQTVIAFKTPNTGLVICENVWSRATGMHLNKIDRDKSKRVDFDTFRVQLENVLNFFNLDITNKSY
jgi:hypothetical protein